MTLEQVQARIQTRTIVGLIALTVAFAAETIRSTGEHLEWFTPDDVAAGILLAVWIGGLVVFAVAFGSLWWIGQRLEDQNRRILGDEFQTALSRRNAIIAFAVTFIAAVLVSVVPGSEQLPGDATASAIVAVSAATLASTHVASPRG